MSNEDHKHTEDSGHQQATASQPGDAQAAPEPAKTRMDPVRKWTFILLAAVVLLLAWYLVSGRLAPFTSQARVHALVVPVATTTVLFSIASCISGRKAIAFAMSLFDSATVSTNCLFMG